MLQVYFRFTPQWSLSNLLLFRWYQHSEKKESKRAWIFLQLVWFVLINHNLRSLGQFCFDICEQSVLLSKNPAKHLLDLVFFSQFVYRLGLQPQVIKYLARKELGSYGQLPLFHAPLWSTKCLFPTYRQSKHCESPSFFQTFFPFHFWGFIHGTWVFCASVNIWTRVREIRVVQRP
jgi:hypothetical protein